MRYQNKECIDLLFRVLGVVKLTEFGFLRDVLVSQKLHETMHVRNNYHRLLCK